MLLPVCIVSGLASVYQEVIADWMLLHPDDVYEAGTYEVTTTWRITVSILSFLFGVVSGVFCTLLCKRVLVPATWLALFVLVSNLTLGIMYSRHYKDDQLYARGQEITRIHIMAYSKPRVIYRPMDAILAGAGIMIGGLLVARKREPEQPGEDMESGDSNLKSAI